MVSVVIPVYNAAPFVRKAVESAISLAEVTEVLLVEDNSPDDSLAVCQALAREYAKVKLLRHPDGGNHGAGASRNLGIRNARGQYIAFLDADDWYLPNRFQTSLPILESRPDVDGVFEAGGVAFQSDNIRNQWLNIGGPLIDPCLKGDQPKELLDALRHGARLQTNCFTVRRSLFEITGLFDEHLINGQDTVLWWKMALTCKVVPGNLAEPVAIRLFHPLNRSAPWSSEEHRRNAANMDRWNTVWQWCSNKNIPFNRKRYLLRRLIHWELGRSLRYSRLFRPLEYLLRPIELLNKNQSKWDLTLREKVYAYYCCVIGILPMVLRLTRFRRKVK